MMQSDKEVSRLALVRNILNVLCLLATHLKIYPQGSPAIRVTTSRLLLQLEKYFAAEDHLDLIVARHGFLHDDLFVDRSSPVFQKFANLLFMHGVAELKLHSGVSEYELITFLRLVGRNPAESWDEGGVRGGLELRRIDNIEVVELSEKDFLLSDKTTTNPLGKEEGEYSDLWNRFARGLLPRQDDHDAEAAPGGLEPEELAREASVLLAGQGNEEQQRFMREVSAYLVALQHENIRAYRAKALVKLARFINQLSENLKRLFLQNILNYNLKADFAEDFFSALSDDLIMDALESAARGKNYVPPVVLNLLGKLARSRDLLPVDSLRPQDAIEGGQEEKARELFRPDEFEKFVPENYRHALLQILRSEELDGGCKEELSRLKMTLQEEKVEEHVGQIILHIIRHDADERHLGGLFGNLEKILELHAAAGHYFAINDIISLCIAKDATAEQALRKIFESQPLIELILDGVNRFGKEKFDSLKSLITTVGEPFVEPLLDRLATEKNRSTRHFYIQCLKGLGAEVATRAGQRLGDPRWYYLRNLLTLLQEVGGAAQTGMVRPLYRHAHPKVRQEALRTGLFFDDALARRFLLEELDSSENHVVVAAVVLARQSPAPEIYAGLAALLEKNELFDYRLDLKRGVVAALVEIDPRQALPLLRQFLSRHNLIHPFHHAELCRDITHILTGLGQRPPGGTSQAKPARSASAGLNRSPGETS